jgi:hypothetical protein
MSAFDPHRTTAEIAQAAAEAQRAREAEAQRPRTSRRWPITIIVLVVALIGSCVWGRAGAPLPSLGRTTAYEALAMPDGRWVVLVHTPEGRKFVSPSADDAYSISPALQTFASREAAEDAAQRYLSLLAEAER